MPQTTSSWVTSPFDQVASTVAGREGAVPEGVAMPATSATEAMVAGSTVTSTVTGSPQPSTLPVASKEPPSRIE